MALLRTLVLTIVLSTAAATAGLAAWTATPSGAHVGRASVTAIRPVSPRRGDGQLRTVPPSELLVVPNRNEGSTAGRLALLSLALVFVVITVVRRRPGARRRPVPCGDVTPRNLSLRAPPATFVPSFSR